MPTSVSPRRTVYSNSPPTTLGSEADAPGVAALATKQSAANSFQGRFIDPPGLFDERARRLSALRGDAKDVPFDNFLREMEKRARQGGTGSTNAPCRGDGIYWS